jgi:aminomethyltransferase
VNTDGAASKIVHAEAYDVVRMSVKRRDESPYIERWRSDDVVFATYANRTYPVSLGGDALADYWKLRRGVVLYDVPEKPLSIKGPAAVSLLERVFCRRVGDLKRWRARYAIACAPDGGIVMDGVLIRIAGDHFWYVQADGDFENWLLAHSVGMEVEVSDPGSWVLQIQGPRSFEVLTAASGAPVPADFSYFRAGMFDFGGQQVLISRTGFTGELGFEIYSHRGIDHLALWDHIMVCGEPSGLVMGAGDSMGPRRIEAGILDNKTDIDRSMTPFAAGLGALADFANLNFVGRDALKSADRRCLLFGLVSATAIPASGNEVLVDGRAVGRMTVGDWSPTLEAGIGYVRFHTPADGPDGWLGEAVVFRDNMGNEHAAKIVNLPFFDAEKRIPRGLEAVS